MAVTFDANSGGDSYLSSVSSFSFNHTVASQSNRCLLVFLHLSGDYSNLSVQFNGVEMTPLYGNDQSLRLRAFVMMNPPIGTYAMTGSWSGFTQKYRAISLSYYNVGACLLGGDKIGTSGTIEASFLTESGELIVGGCGSLNGVTFTDRSGTTTIATRRSELVVGYASGSPIGWNTSAGTGGYVVVGLRLTEVGPKDAGHDWHSSSYQAASGATSMNHIHNVGVMPKTVLFANLITSNVVTSPAVSFGGQSLTLLDTWQAASNTRIYRFYLVNPTTTGYGLLSASWTNNVWKYLQAVNFYQVDSFEDAGNAKANNTNATITVTSAAREIILAQLATWAEKDFTPGSGQVDLFARTVTRAVAAYKAGAASTTISWTISTSIEWGIEALRIKSPPPVSAGTVMWW